MAIDTKFGIVFVSEAELAEAGIRRTKRGHWPMTGRAFMLYDFLTELAREEAFWCFA